MAKHTIAECTRREQKLGRGRGGGDRPNEGIAACSRTRAACTYSYPYSWLAMELSICIWLRVHRLAGRQAWAARHVCGTTARSRAGSRCGGCSVCRRMHTGRPGQRGRHDRQLTLPSLSGHREAQQPRLGSLCTSPTPVAQFQPAPSRRVPGRGSGACRGMVGHGTRAVSAVPARCRMSPMLIHGPHTASLDPMAGVSVPIPADERHRPGRTASLGAQPAGHAGWPPPVFSEHPSSEMVARARLRCDAGRVIRSFAARSLLFPPLFSVAPQLAEYHRALLLLLLLLPPSPALQYLRTVVPSSLRSRSFAPFSTSTRLRSLESLVGLLCFCPPNRRGPSKPLAVVLLPPSPVFIPHIICPSCLACASC